MFVKKTLAAAGLLAMTGAVAACGGGSSSSAAPAGAAGAPAPSCVNSAFAVCVSANSR